MPIPSLAIEHISTTIFRLPMFGALRWGKSSSLAEARHVLVQVTLNDGSQGIAEAPPRPTIYGETVYSITSIIEHELAPRVVGIPVEKVQARLQEIKNNHAAKGALDMALQDALAQHAGCSLAGYLGAQKQQLKVSYILGIGDREMVLAEAQRVFDQGVRVLKVKVGREWEEDIARIRDLQQMFGSAMALYADANECLEPAEAAHKLAYLHEMGLLYCEEALPVELIRERAALRSQQVMPLIADDSCFTVRDLQRELALDTFDILNIKTARTGYTESQSMLALALQHGKGVMIGSQASAGLGTVRAAIFAALPGIEHPSELSFFLKLKEDIIDRSISIVDGYIDLADVHNIGVDPDLLRAAAVE
ncbi:MAG: enolase [Chloroflexi bacterium]|nr:enolase [Chloroflexota bacterium]